jgi:hypothetical protein
MASNPCMHATIRQYNVTGDPHALSRSIQETFIPQLKLLPGYVSYMWIDPSVEGGRMLSVSVFATAEQAEASNAVAATWVAAHPDFELQLINIEIGPVVAHG